MTLPPLCSPATPPRRPFTGRQRPCVPPPSGTTTAGPIVLEVTPPREPVAGPGAVENLPAALAHHGRGGCALEVVGAAGCGPRFLARAPDTAAGAHLAHQLQAVYPQAHVHVLANPADDPVRLRPGEEASCVELRLRAPVYLPLRMYRDIDAREGNDPLAGVLGALSGAAVPPAMRVVCQLALWPADRDWAAGLNPAVLTAASRGAQVQATEQHTGDLSLPLVGLLGAALAAYKGYLLFQEGDWLHLLIGVVAVLLAVPLALWLRDVLGAAPPPDPLLVREKVAHAAAVVRLRLLVAGGTAPERRLLLDRLVAAYGPFAHPAGNSLVACPAKATDLCLPRPSGGRLPRPGGGVPPLLNAREIAGLWHLPATPATVPGVVHAPVRAILAAHPAVAGETARRAGGLFVGISRAQGQTVPAYLPRGHLVANTLVLGAAGTGKTTYLLRLLAEVLADPTVGIFVLDPHGALAPRVLSLLPPQRAADASCVLLGDREHPVALNLLDVRGGRAAEEIENGLIGGFAYHWEGAWGARMEPIFRRALRTLLAANLQRAAAEQYTLLDVTLLLTNEKFRLAVLKQVTDRDLHRYWLEEYAHYYARERDNWIQPVLNKIAAFSGPSLRNIVGQSECKVDLRSLVEHSAPLIVDTDARRLGVATAGLLGATLLEQLACLLRERGEGRSRVLIVVDEFQLTPADWATMVEGLRKFGATFVLATQSLTALERTQPGLRGAVFGNQATLVCHRVSAEDARYLTPELDEAVERTDLINLGVHQAYLKTTDGAARLPTFSVEVPLPPAGDPVVAATVRERSARRWGSPRALVEAAYQDYLYRLYTKRDEEGGGATPDGRWVQAGSPVQGSRMPLAEAPATPPQSAVRAPVPAAASPIAPTAEAGRTDDGAPRKSGRSRNPPRGGAARQESLFGGAADAGTETAS